MEKKQGRIFDVQRMSLHDGPGIRTTIFLKGCNLRCFWCHNPESARSDNDLQYFAQRCIGCGLCKEACPHQLHHFTPAHQIDREQCMRCGLCAEACPAQALVYVGRSVSVEEILPELLRDVPFYRNTGGGVTLSGGEPLLQPAFASELLKALKENGVNTLIETALHLPWENIEQVIPWTDHFYVDFKHPDDEMHKKVTGVSNKRILENLQRLDKTGCAYTVRIPTIPGVNDSEDTFRAIDRALQGLSSLKEVELMPYHAFGVGKYESLGMDTETFRTMQPPSVERLTELAACIRCVPVSFRDGGKQVRFLKGESV